MLRLTQRQRKTGRVLIPTASMSDIATLLIIFFVLTTVFRKEVGLPVFLPQADNTERILKSRDIANVYVDREGRISVDDRLVEPGYAARIFQDKYRTNRGLIVQIKADREAPYGRVDDVMENLRDVLREAPVIRLVFATEEPRR